MHFPLFVDLTDKPCLVVGAGPVAARKVRILADFGARVTVVAPAEGGVCRGGVPACRGGVPAAPERNFAKFLSWGGEDASPTKLDSSASPTTASPTKLVFLCRPFQVSDIAVQTLVVAATDDAALNARIASLCRAAGIPVNVVDDPANCTFLFPAIARKGPVVAAVSTGGACPVATQVLRDRVEGLMTDRFCETVARLGAQREQLKKEFPDPAARRDRMRKELESC